METITEIMYAVITPRGTVLAAALTREGIEELAGLHQDATLERVRVTIDRITK